MNKSRTLFVDTIRNSMKSDDTVGESSLSSFCAAELSSCSSKDLSSMIASWVDRNSCSEYEKELKLSSGSNFRAIAMRKCRSETLQAEKLFDSSKKVESLGSNRNRKACTDETQADDPLPSDRPSKRQRSLEIQDFSR